MELFKVVFGSRVRFLRKDLHWSQEKLAEKSSLSRETISRIERGKYGTQFAHVDTIVKAFDVSFSEFFKDLEE